MAGAVAFARSQWAPPVEGYPVDNRGEMVNVTMANVRTRALFEKAGFNLASNTAWVVGGFTRMRMERR